MSAESIKDVLVNLKTWKSDMEKKSLRVHMGEIKIMVPGINLDLLKKKLERIPVCQTGVGSNGIFCETKVCPMPGKGTF